MVLIQQELLAEKGRDADLWIAVVCWTERCPGTCSCLRGSSTSSSVPRPTPSSTGIASCPCSTSRRTMPEGSPEQHRVAEGEAAQSSAAYQLIRTAPLRDAPLAKTAAAREEERVRDPGLAVDRPVSVATETVARFALGVAVGLFLASPCARRGVPGFRIYVWVAPPHRGHSPHVLPRVSRRAPGVRVPETLAALCEGSAPRTPYTLSRAPLRRRASSTWLTRCRSFALSEREGRC